MLASIYLHSQIRLVGKSFCCCPSSSSGSKFWIWFAGGESIPQRQFAELCAEIREPWETMSINGYQILLWTSSRTIWRKEDCGILRSHCIIMHQNEVHMCEFTNLLGKIHTVIVVHFCWKSERKKEYIYI